MSSSESSGANVEEDADLSTRVEALENALADQADTLQELRAEVRRLRSALDAPPTGDSSTEDGTVDDEDSKAPVEDSEEAPSTTPSQQVSEGPAADPSTSPIETETAERDLAPAESGLSEADVDPTGRSPETTSSSTETDDAKATSSSPPSETPEALLDRLVSWAGLRSEDWLNYAGIGLFLFGVVFLLKYSIEQGWLGPVVRVGFGGALGLVLLRTGLRLPSSRTRLRQVLLGGSSATFYASTFAAYQFYGLIAYSSAFTTMVLVTVGTVSLAVQQDEPTLSIIGVLGGLGTPFLLYTEAGSLVGFSIYTGLVLGGACAVYLIRGWRSLLYTTVAGGWTVFFTTAVRVNGAPPTEAWALQAGIGGAWLLLAGTPVLRALLRRRAPSRWPVVPLPNWTRPLAGDNRRAYGLVTVSPFIAFASTRLLWRAPDGTWALLAGIGALIYGGAYLGLRRASLSKFAPVHALVAAVLAAFGLAKALGGSALLIAWSVEAFLLLSLANRLDERLFRFSGHALFAVVVAFLAFRLSTLAEGGYAGLPFVRPDALSNLIAIALIGGASVALPSRGGRWGYRVIALLGWLAWTAAELIGLSNGPHYILIVWTGTGTAMAAAHPYVRDDAPLRTVTNSLFVGVGLLFSGLTIPAMGQSNLLQDLIRLGALGLGLTAAQSTNARQTRSIYRSAVLVGWLAWLPSALLSLSHGGAYTLVSWALTGAGLSWVAPSLEENTFRVRSTVHVLFGILGASLAVRLLSIESSATPILSVPALSELAVLGLAFGVSWIVERTSIRRLYRGAVLVGWLAWTAQKMGPVPNGTAYTSALWAVTATVLLLVGARYDRRSWQIGGLATLAVFVAKLFLVDLASLPPLWRIGLFLGSGATFLGVSYFLPSLIPGPSDDSDDPGG